jgi:hypothetical protein
LTRATAPSTRSPTSARAVANRDLGYKQQIDDRDRILTGTDGNSSPTARSHQEFRRHDAMLRTIRKVDRERLEGLRSMQSVELLDCHL